MTYKLNNTLTLIYKTGVERKIPCSSISFSRPNMMSLSGGSERINAYGRDSVCFSCDLEDVREFTFTDLPTENEPDPEKETPKNVTPIKKGGK